MNKLGELENFVLSLIDRKMSINEICTLLNISYQDMYGVLSSLRMHGINITEKYYINGETRYEIARHSSLKNQYKNTIITSKDDNEFDMMLISDLHYGSYYETNELLDEIYDFCVKNNIHVILNIGDFLEGVNNLPNIRIPWDEQIYYALEKHPFDKNILEFLVLGNHDHSILKTYGQDIRKVIKNIRGDIIPLNFGKADIKIKNDKIILQHPILVKDFQNGSYKHTLIIRGHGHEPKVFLDGCNYVIYVPSLSNLNFVSCEFPGAIKMHIQMSCGNIINVELDELAFIHNKMYVTNKVSIFTGRGKDYSEKKIIENEEDCKVLKKV